MILRVCPTGSLRGFMDDSDDASGLDRLEALDGIEVRQIHNDVD
jgi:hypothetical protein